MSNGIGRKASKSLLDPVSDDDDGSNSGTELPTVDIDAFKELAPESPFNNMRIWRNSNLSITPRPKALPHPTPGAKKEATTPLRKNTTTKNGGTPQASQASGSSSSDSEDSESDSSGSSDSDSSSSSSDDSATPTKLKTTPSKENPKPMKLLPSTLQINHTFAPSITLKPIPSTPASTPPTSGNAKLTSTPPKAPPTPPKTTPPPKTPSSSYETDPLVLIAKRNSDLTIFPISTPTSVSRSNWETKKTQSQPVSIIAAGSKVSSLRFSLDNSDGDESSSSGGVQRAINIVDGDLSNNEEVIKLLNTTDGSIHARTKLDISYTSSGSGGRSDKNSAINIKTGEGSSSPIKTGEKSKITQSSLCNGTISIPKGLTAQRISPNPPGGASSSPSPPKKPNKLSIFFSRSKSPRGNGIVEEYCIRKGPGVVEDEDEGSSPSKRARETKRKSRKTVEEIPNHVISPKKGGEVVDEHVNSNGNHSPTSNSIKTKAALKNYSSPPLPTAPPPPKGQSSRSKVGKKSKKKKKSSTHKLKKVTGSKRTVWKGEKSKRKSGTPTQEPSPRSKFTLDDLTVALKASSISTSKSPKKSPRKKLKAASFTRKVYSNYSTPLLTIEISDKRSNDEYNELLRDIYTKRQLQETSRTTPTTSPLKSNGRKKRRDSTPSNPASEEPQSVQKLPLKKRNVQMDQGGTIIKPLGVIASEKELISWQFGTPGSSQWKGVRVSPSSTLRKHSGRVIGESLLVALKKEVKEIKALDFAGVAKAGGGKKVKKGSRVAPPPPPQAKRKPKPSLTILEPELFDDPRIIKEEAELKKRKNSRGGGGGPSLMAEVTPGPSNSRRRSVRIVKDKEEEVKTQEMTPPVHPIPPALGKVVKIKSGEPPRKRRKVQHASQDLHEAQTQPLYEIQLETQPLTSNSRSKQLPIKPKSRKRVQKKVGGLKVVPRRKRKKTKSIGMKKKKRGTITKVEELLIPATHELIPIPAEYDVEEGEILPDMNIIPATTAPLELPPPPTNEVKPGKRGRKRKLIENSQNSEEAPPPEVPRAPRGLKRKAKSPKVVQMRAKKIKLSPRKKEADPEASTEVTDGEATLNSTVEEGESSTLPRTPLVASRKRRKVNRTGFPTLKKKKKSINKGVAMELGEEAATTAPQPTPEPSSRLSLPPLDPQFTSSLTERVKTRRRMSLEDGEPPFINPSLLDVPDLPAIPPVKTNYLAGGLLSTIYKVNEGDPQPDLTSRKAPPPPQGQDPPQLPEYKYLPYPEYMDEQVMMKKREFLLPYDIWCWAAIDAKAKAEKYEEEFERERLEKEKVAKQLEMIEKSQQGARSTTPGTVIKVVKGALRPKSFPMPDVIPESWHFKKIRTNSYCGTKPAKQSRDESERDVGSSCNCPDGEPGEYKCHTDDCLNRVMYTECPPSCGENCKNQRIRNREYAPNLRRLVTKEKGYGVFTYNFIKRGEFILEYLGEIVTDEVFKERMRTIYADDKHHYCLQIDSTLVIDGHRVGGECRFVNHSCEPNCEIQKWSIDGKDHMTLFAKRDINAGEELSYDYNFCLYNPSQGQPCYCGSGSCRGVIGGRTKPRPPPVKSNTMHCISKKKPGKFAAGVGFQAIGGGRHDPAVNETMRLLTKKDRRFLLEKRCFLPRNYEKVRRMRGDAADKLGARVEKILGSWSARFKMGSSRNKPPFLNPADLSNPKLVKLVGLGQGLYEFYCKLTGVKDESGYLLTAQLMLMPPKRKCPEFYEASPEPLDLTLIRERIIRGYYGSIGGFEADLGILFKCFETVDKDKQHIQRAIGRIRELFEEEKVKMNLTPMAAALVKGSPEKKMVEVVDESSANVSPITMEKNKRAAKRARVNGALMKLIEANSAFQKDLDDSPKLLIKVSEGGDAEVAKEEVRNGDTVEEAKEAEAAEDENLKMEVSS